MSKTTRLLYAISSGLLLGLAWADWMHSILLLVAFVPLLLVEDNLFQNKKTNRPIQAFYYSLLSFFIWNLTTTWWIILATPTGMIIVVLLNSLFMATVFWLFHFSKRLLGMKTGNFLFIIFWIGFEYFHLNWEMSWSWLNLGNAFAKDIGLIQWYEYTGSLGGSLWVVSANMIMSTGLLKIIQHKNVKAGLIHVVVFLLLIIIPIGISQFIFSTYQEKGETCNVVIIQPNIEPYLVKFDGMPESQQLDVILGLAEKVANKEVDYFVAPETSLSEAIWEDELKTSESVSRIIGFLRKYSSAEFVIGAVTGQMYFADQEIPATAEKYGDANMYYDEFNSALQISSDSSIQIYHKSQLILGVEKMPFPGTLGFLENLAIDLGGSNGSLGCQSEREVFTSENNPAKVAPVICYESVFGDYVNDYIRLGANVIFMITNDGWWGTTSGYFQHTRYSRLRAIETRRSVARSGNTGITCFINQKGEQTQTANYWEPAVLEETVSLNNEFTFYTKSGDYIGRIFSFLAVLGIFYTIVAKLKRGDEVE